MLILALLVQRLQTALQGVYNESQMAAITAGLSGQPINLIQASPPTQPAAALGGSSGLLNVARLVKQLCMLPTADESVALTAPQYQ